MHDGKIEELVERLREIAAEHAEIHPNLTKEVLAEADNFATNTKKSASRI